MSDRVSEPLYCEVSLPVPLDRPFSYALPESLRHRVRRGARVNVSFGSRKLTGVVLKTHRDQPAAAIKDVESLVDETPVFDDHLLQLGAWIGGYYCAPLGEVLRGMAPLTGEIGKRRTWALTPKGRDVVRQLTLGNETSTDPSVEILRALEKRPLSEATLAAKVEKARTLLKSLAKREFVCLEESLHVRQPRGTGAVSVTAHGGQRFALNHTQQAALDSIAAGLKARNFAAALLHGVTGSGKTEVYLRAIEMALAQGLSALLMVPEIALTPQVAGQFAARFGNLVAILHSAFNDTERAREWRRIQSGEARVALGTRSAVFAPMKDLGLLIVDEEHDGSYKQEETPRYHGRDVAVMRATMLGALVVLGSATPALESRYNAEKGKYTLLAMPERIEQRPLPEVELIDMREEFLATRKQQNFSRRLIEEIAARAASKEQVMLLMNRRGFSSFVSCRACGERIMCVNCSVTLTYHRRDRRLLCHYCNYADRVPDKCPKCDSDYLYFSGSGSERIEEELHRDFPGLRIARMDRDTVNGKQDYESILQGFRAGEYDILVGTQMIAKGHDIPNVTLVGIVNADIGLGMPDFRAAERTFQLLTQAAGRAGRGQVPGRVLIQTVNPDHYAIRFASQQNYAAFYEKELEFRRVMRYPPFAALANVVVRAEDQSQAMQMSGVIANLLTPPPDGLKVLGPSEAPVPRLKREFRYQTLLKSASRKSLAWTLEWIRQMGQSEKWPATSLVIDVDPMSLM